VSSDLTQEVGQAFQDMGLMAPTPESEDFESAFDGGPSESSESEVEGEPSDDDDGENDFRARIWNAETECRKRELEVELIKDDLKEAKAAYDDAVDRLRKLAREATQPTLFSMAKGSSKPTGEPQPEVDESWKEREICQWIDELEIDGFGDTKREALKELVDTFGDFDCIRAEARKTHQHLSKLMPKGIGQGLADAIEEAFLAEIGK
jgi:hypothetical protein